MVREQLTIDGAGELRSGDVLCIGRSVRLELTKPRVPCHVMDKVRPGLRAELEGRGGWCARVLDGGEVRCGDEVSIEGATGDPRWLADYLAAMADWEASPSLYTADGDGWTTFEDRLAHLVAWDQRAAERIEAVAAGADPTSFGPTDLDAFNADAVASVPRRRPLGPAGHLVHGRRRRRPPLARRRRALGPRPDQPLPRAHRLTSVCERRGPDVGLCVHKRQNLRPRCRSASPCRPPAPASARRSTPSTRRWTTSSTASGATRSPTGCSTAPRPSATTA